MSSSSILLLSLCPVQESKLRAENGRLQLELEAVRADRERLLSSQQDTTSGQTTPGWQLPALPTPTPQQQPQVCSITDGHGVMLRTTRGNVQSDLYLATTLLQQHLCVECWHGGVAQIQWHPDKTVVVRCCQLSLAPCITHPQGQTRTRQLVEQA